MAQTQAISSTIFYLSVLLAVVSVSLYFLAPHIFLILNWHFTSEELAAILKVMSIYLLILFVSGWVVIANAILNTSGSSVFPATAQLVVPVMVFFALLLFGSTHGIYAAAYGMLAGQVANLGLVIYALRRYAFLPSLWPDTTVTLKVLPLRQYSLIVATALLAALFVPVANAIAANLPAGSVAIIGLGMKAVLLVTGVIGVGMTTVLLPYFSSLAAKFNHHQARSDLSFFLLFVTLLSVPTALVMTMIVEPVARIIFASSVLTAEDIHKLIRVIQYGLIQLPFFTCGLVAIKYITAYQRTWIILLSSLIGLVLAAALGVIFSRIFGVSGIALAMTLSMAASTAILVSYANYLKHLPVSDSIFIVFNWVIFITLFICLHYQVYVGAVICGAAYLLLVAGNLNAVISHAYGGETSFRYRLKSG